MCAVLVQSLLPLSWIEPKIAKNDVHCRSSMSFGHDDAVSLVPIRIFWIDLCLVIIKNRQSIHNRHDTADMTDAEASNHLDCVVT